MLVVAGALIDAAGRVLMHQRPMAKHHGGLWEFPGGKVEKGESPEMALARELAEELGVSIDSSNFKPLSFVVGTIPSNGTGSLVILLYTCRIWQGEPQALEGEGVRWCTPAECAELCLAPLDRDLLPTVSAAVANR